MAEYFKDHRRMNHRAVQIWQILVGSAHNRQTLTYKQLAEKVGYGGSGVFDKQLGHIMFYCAQNKLPPLTVLVVNSKTGLPGQGLLVEKNLHVEREKVFNYNWFGIYPPTAEALSEAYEKAREKGWKL